MSTNNYFSSNMSNILEKLGSFRPGMDLESVKGAIDQFEIDLNQQMKNNVERISSRTITTMEEELQKRTELLKVAEEKHAILRDLLYQTVKIPELSDYVVTMIEAARLQVNFYKKSIHYVERVQSAKIEKYNLEQERQNILKQLNQAPTDEALLQDLDRQVKEVYNRLHGSTQRIDFNAVVRRKKELLEQQQKVVDMVDLAKNTKGAEHYLPDYQEQYKVRQLELDSLFEKQYVYFLQKFGRRSVSNSNELVELSEAIQNVTHGRLAQVHHLCSEGLASKRTHTTFAQEVSGFISNPLSQIHQKRSLEGRLMEIDHRLNQISKLSSKTVSDLDHKSRRRKVVKTKPASSNLLKKINFSALKRIAVAALTSITILAAGLTAVDISQALHNNHVSQDIVVNELLESSPMSAYSPSIGDKIVLNNDVKIYSNSLEAITGENGYEASKTIAKDKELYVTRARIFDESNNQIYTTTEYGIDLNQVAYDMGKEEGTYSIALGCSIGDENGNFIEVSQTALNPKIEMGWVNAADQNITVIEQLSSSLEKGGRLI